MAYIETIHEIDAEGKLKALYQRFGNPDATVDNVLKLHSLNPETLESHAGLYLQAMHHPGPIERHEREIIGVIVSRANACEYCLRHHAAGLRRLLEADRPNLSEQLVNGDQSGLNDRETAMSAYAEKLARTPNEIDHHDVDMMRGAGLDDREILDVCQIASYFAYANRIALGLGAELEEETKIGQWPRG
jgi:uncharacterized peroxidase-related enzyme